MVERYALSDRDWVYIDACGWASFTVVSMESGLDNRQVAFSVPIADDRQRRPTLEPCTTAKKTTEAKAVENFIVQVE